jgi:hypothetical protein
MLDRLFFGLARPGGGVVSDEEWQAFLATVVTPRFPAGLTVLAARGQWQDQVDGTVGGEDARVVEILHDDSAAASAAVAAIVADYKARFAQQAVLVVRSRVESCL